MAAGHLTRRRLAATLGLLFLALAAAAAVSILFGVTQDATGARHLSVLDLGRSDDLDIFYLARLPRALAGIVAGAGLAAAGVVFQALLRNPLAEPYTLGVSSGAALCAVFAISLGLEASVGPTAVALAAFAGAGATVVLVWRLARVGESRPGALLLLAGVTIAFTCSAASMFIQVTAEFTEGQRIIRWMLGGLDWISYGETARSGAVVAVGAAALLYLARDFNALAAGSDAAASVGVAVDRTTRIAYVSASLMVGAIVALSGPIGFVGIIVPHGLRAMVGPDHRVLLPAALVGGPAFVLLADALARVALWPSQLPVGVITALVGGPFFLALLLREKGRARLWGA